MSDAVTIRVTRGQAKGSFVITLYEGDPAAASPGTSELARVEGVKAPKAAPLQMALRELTGDVRKIGGDLGKFLFAGDISDGWKKRVSNAVASLRTYVDLGNSGLDGLPWEMTLLEGTPVFLRTSDPVVMFGAGRKGSEPKPESGLRVLVAVVAKDEDGALGCEAEARGIRTAVRELNRVIDVRIERHLSRELLKRVIDEYKPHVVHLTGHGDDDGVQLYDGTTTTPWGPNEASTDVNGWNWKPDLLYLNTCRGAAATLSEKGARTQTDLVSRLLQERIPAVVAMRADVRGQVAREGAEEFYTKLARGAAVDEATAAARARIARVAPGRESDFAPYLPHLVVARPVETILRHTAVVELADPCETIDTTLRTFVDRDEQRRELLRVLDSGARCVIVQGSGEVGKSWLLQWCMDAWRRRNLLVRYVPIAGLRTWLDVVRAIRDGDPALNGSIHRGMPEQARSLLNWRLNGLAAGQADPSPEGLKEGIQEDTARTNLLVNSDKAMVDAHIKAMGALQAALEKEAGERGLVVVLDNFTAGDQGFSRPQFSTLCEHWINQLVVRQPSGPVRVVLGMGQNQREEFGLKTPPNGFQVVSLDYFAYSDFQDLILELLPLRYAEQLGNNKEKAVKWLSGELVDFQPTEYNQPFTGVFLQDLCETIWRYCQGKSRRWKQ